MWGVEGLTRALGDRLGANLPGALQRIRARYNLTAADLPDVVHIYPSPRDYASVAGYPCIMLAAQDTEGRLSNRIVENAEVYDEYSFTYRVRCLLYVMGDDYNDTELRTQRLTLAVREALLTDRRLGDPEQGDGGELDTRALRESYAETAPTAGMFLGAAYVELGARSTERLTIGPEPVQVDDVITDVIVHPDLDVETGTL